MLLPTGTHTELQNEILHLRRQVEWEREIANSYRKAIIELLAEKHKDIVALQALLRSARKV